MIFAFCKTSSGKILIITLLVQGLNEIQFYIAERGTRLMGTALRVLPAYEQRTAITTLIILLLTRKPHEFFSTQLFQKLIVVLS